LSDGNLVEGDSSLRVVEEFEPQSEVIELGLRQVNPLFLRPSLLDPFTYSV
jgi:hypothetical protein